MHKSQLKSHAEKKNATKSNKPFPEWSVDSGCRNLRCAKDGKMEVHFETYFCNT